GDVQPFGLQLAGELAGGQGRFADEPQIFAHRPAMARPSTISDGEFEALRSSRSAPGIRRPKMSIRLPATVISLTGKAMAPFSNQKPDTPADQSPVFEFSEGPNIEVTSRPLPASRIRPAWSSGPGFRVMVV